MATSCKHHVDPLCAYLHGLVQMTCETCDLPKGMSTGQIASNLTFLLQHAQFKSPIPNNVQALTYPSYTAFKIVMACNDEGDFTVSLMWKNTVVIESGTVSPGRSWAVERFAECVEEEVTKVIRSGKAARLTGMEE